MAGNEAPQVYMNNPKLKSAGVEVEFSAHHVEELRKCYEDPIYFIKNYVYITNIDKGVIKFSLYDFQEEIVARAEESEGHHGAPPSGGQVHHDGRSRPPLCSFQ